MKVWIINPYGNLPGEGWSPYRSTSIAQALTKRGHEVTWWVSDFEHRSKKRRACGTVDYGNGFSARVVRSSSYSRHISWERIKYERSYASNLTKVIRDGVDRPDVIVHSDPAVCFSDISMKAVRHCACPLVIDVIDLWPELFEIAFPPTLRWLARLLLQPFYAKRGRFFRRADGFLAVSKDYLDLAQRLAPGKPGAVAYLGTEVKAYNLPINNYNTIRAKKPGEIWCIYVGTLGSNYDVAALLQCSSFLKGHNVRVFVAGDGDLRPQVEAAARQGQLDYLGRMSFENLTAIYPYYDIALAGYAPGSTVSMPFKAFDYLAAGLPIVTSLAGDLGMFVRTKGIGETYISGNADSLGRAVLSLACDSKRRESAGRAAKRLGASMDYGIQYSVAADFIEQISKKTHINR